jgi:hypothetical protein
MENAGQKDFMLIFRVNIKIMNWRLSSVLFHGFTKTPPCYKCTFRLELIFFTSGPE